MSLTITPVLKKKNKNDKFGIINIRIIEDRKSKYFSLKIKIDEKDWNKKYRQIKPNNPNHKELNTLIQTEIKKLEKTENIQEVVLDIPVNESSFLKFFKKEKDTLFKRNQIGTYKTYNTAYKHLEKYLQSIGEKDIDVNSFDGLFVRDFESYLLSIVSLNSCNKYLSILKKVYHDGLKYDVIPYTKKDPFILFENRRDEVKKPYLQKKEIEKIIQTKIDNKDINDVKNLFLFQVFGQGLRISDLLTLRWENYDFDTESFIFIQQKTGKSHQLFLNNMNMRFLISFYPNLKELYEKTIVKIKLKGKVEKQMSIQELRDKYKELNEKYLSKTIQYLFNKSNGIEVDEKDDYSSLLDSWKKVLNEREEYVLTIIFNEIKKYKFSKIKGFVFPLLKDVDFSDVDFSKPVNLTKYQFNQLGSKTAVYNKRLKTLQKLCEVETIITSHIARHTYTNLLLEYTSWDVLSVSQSLGHQRLSTTQQYINQVGNKKAKNINNDLINNFQL
jgi:integrase